MLMITGPIRFLRFHSLFPEPVQYRVHIWGRYRFASPSRLALPIANARSQRDYAVRPGLDLR